MEGTMTNYIPADKLIAEIRKLLIPTVHDRDYDEWEHGRDSGFIQAISIIESLQQEEPEVDLEKEMEEHVMHMPFNDFANDSEVSDGMEWVKAEFLHFYELGLNARKEE